MNTVCCDLIYMIKCEKNHNTVQADLGPSCWYTVQQAL